MPISIVGTTASVTGLTNGTMYRFRVAARNGLGYGPYSDSTSAGTPSGAAPPPPSAKPGDSWTALGSQVSVLAFANNRFIGVGPLASAQSSYMWYSSTGSAWSPAAAFTHGTQSPQPFRASSVAFGGGTWVAACYSASEGSATGLKYGVSSDGESWSPVTAPLQAPWVIYDTYQFVAVRSYAVNASPTWVSANGLSWGAGLGNAQGLALSAAASRAFYGNAASQGGLVAGTVRTRLPGTGDPFASTPIPADTMPVYGGATAGWIAVTTGSDYYTSSDGTSWTKRSLPGGVVVPRPRLSTGSDAAMHRPNPSAIAYGNGWWLAMATTPGTTQSRMVIRSQDGISWETAFTLPTVAVWDRIVFGAGKFVASGMSQTGAAMAVTQ